MQQLLLTLFSIISLKIKALKSWIFLSKYAIGNDYATWTQSAINAISSVWERYRNIDDMGVGLFGWYGFKPLTNDCLLLTIGSNSMQTNTTKSKHPDFFATPLIDGPQERDAERQTEAERDKVMKCLLSPICRPSAAPWSTIKTNISKDVIWYRMWYQGTRQPFEAAWHMPTSWPT